MCSLADADLSNVVPCSHEEADTRLFLHASDAIRKGHKKLSVRTVGTDVVILAISTFSETDVVILAISTFSEINPDELWLAFGTGSNFRYIPIHDSKLLLTCILEFVLLSQCFMHLQDAILSQHFVAEARRQLEIHGNLS